jgi:hypothetical protein
LGEVFFATPLELLPREAQTTGGGLFPYAARCIDTRPAGGCRTSGDVEMDGVADPRRCKGFHQPFIYGRLDRLFTQYCQLSGIEVVPIA